jgi:hypothetical protein
MDQEEFGLSNFSLVMKDVKKPEKEVRGQNQLAIQCIITRFRAIWHVDSGTIQ